MAMLAKQFQRAEAILLDHNELDEALAMYQARPESTRTAAQH